MTEPPARRGPALRISIGREEHRIEWDRRTVIGRDADADVRIDDPTVSRVHAIIDTSGPRPTVEDAGAANGVVRRGKRISGAVELRAKHRYELGAATVEVVEVGQRDVAAAPASRTEVLRRSLARSERRTRVLAGGVALLAVAVGLIVVSRDGEGNATSVRAIARAAAPAVVRIESRPDGATAAQGTGFLIEGDLIVTAAHVVRGRGPHVVVLPDGSERPAEIRAAAACDDLALLDVGPAPGGSLRLGRQRDLSAGDGVVAIGYPASVTGGKDLTITTGVVSVPKSSIAIDNLGVPRLPNVVQTDAAVNPGNSGGPLLDENGAVIGVLSLVVNRLATGDVSGQAYAVGVDRLRELLGPLREGSAPGWRGAMLGSQGGRLVVTSVTEGSPAAEAGVEIGDPATALGGALLPGDLEAFCRGIAIAPNAPITFETSAGDVPV